MKIFLYIFFLIAIVFILQFGCSQLVDIYGCQRVIIAFIAIVILTILYFSLRLCFVKKSSDEEDKNQEKRKEK